jgi:hypothetical protein
MKKSKIAIVAVVVCLLSVSAAQAGPTKQKPPLTEESSLMTEILAFLGFPE